VNTTETKSLSEPVHVFSVGPFGHAVVRYLRVIRADIIESTLLGKMPPPVEPWPMARMRVVAAWRPVPELCELLDQACWDNLLPFIPLVLDSGVLRLGPIVVPGKGSCWNCWVRRFAQHAAWPREQKAVLHHYSSEETSGPQGFLEAFACLAAARISDCIDSLDTSRSIPGSIWEIDLMTRAIMTSKVIGIHGCPRCGLHRAEATRGFAELQQQLAYLWTNVDCQR
jgi:bacteriocin biosynthesis cyclodehydratase domain-containing protein